MVSLVMLTVNNLVTEELFFLKSCEIVLVTVEFILLPSHLGVFQNL